MTTEERLGRLEQELARAKRLNRRLLALIGSALVLFVITWAATHATRPAQAQDAANAQKVIRANSFIVEDENGKPRATLGMNDGVAMLALYDENGKTRVTLDAKPALNLTGGNGRLLASLLSSEDGPAFLLFDQAGNGSGVQLRAAKVGPSMNLSDENGRIRAVVGNASTISEEGRTTPYPTSSVILLGTEGNVIWQAPK